MRVERESTETVERECRERKWSIIVKSENNEK